MTKYFKAVIIDRNAPLQAFKTLNELSILTVLSAKIANIITDLSTHPDMQIMEIQENIFVCEPSVFDYYCEVLSPFNVKILKGATSLTSKYPGDIAYNAARLEVLLLHKTDATDDVIKTNFSGRIVNVNQGYTKCSLCKVSENAVITSDGGIAASLKSEGVDVLEISQDDIVLDGFGYGFIGGCTGLIAKNKLAFCGDITTRRDCGDILTFLKKHNVEAVSLCGGKLTDIGSIIPITGCE